MNNDGCCPRFAINEGGTGQLSAFEIGKFGNPASLGSALGVFDSDGFLDVYTGDLTRTIIGFTGAQGARTKAG